MLNDLELVQERLGKTRISDLHALADQTGVPFGTLFKIKYGTTKNPRHNTVKPLADHFRQGDLPPKREPKRQPARVRP